MNSFPAEHPAFRLVFQNRRRVALRTALFGHIGLLESWFDGDVDLEGDVGKAFAIAMAAGLDRPSALVRLRNRWHEWRFANASVESARANARFHYGLGTPFYRLWLDEALMMYTCAYWEEGTASLEEAQRNKVGHVCRKLLIGPGDEVVDIGCGFGGFMFHAEQFHGARVTGINTAPEQVEMVREEIARRNLGGKLEVVLADFREVRGQYDKVVSIGVLEHAGRDQLDEVVRAHAAALKPGGLGMLHFIGHVGEYETEFFIRKHVFPGGWIPSLSQTLAALERAGCEVLDVENLRRHYALTLDAWAERFERHWPRIQALDPRRFDERFRRVWQAYLYGCAEMFRSPRGHTHLFQITFSKGLAAHDTYPMSRAFLYEATAKPGAELAALRARDAHRRATE